MPKSVGKQMSINIIASIVSFAVTVGINFFLTPYLVKRSAVMPMVLSVLLITLYSMLPSLRPL